MPRVSFYTLGCKLNYAETTTLERGFAERSFEVVPFEEPADVLVVNTCTVTSEAERKARQTIRGALRRHPHAFVIVTGCYAQLRPDELAALDGVDVVLGAQEKFRLFDLVETFVKRERTQVEVSCIDQGAAFGPAYSSGERTRAFLKIQDGCDYACSFCTIPAARGPSRSQPVPATVAQARAIAERGFREVVLSGVNIGLYGREHGTDLLALLRALDRVDGIDRYRISSIEPNLLTDAVIDFVAESRCFQPHFHLPLQSGDDHVLGKMRRRYRRHVYADRVKRIREHLPEAAVGVDVIVGFPAEGEEHFERTCHFIDELPVSYLHVFTYSERPGTPAAAGRVGGRPVPGPERTRRNRVLRMLSRRKEHEHAQAHYDRVRPVLWESPRPDGRMSGYTDNYLRVSREADPARENTIEPVRLGPMREDGTLQALDPDFVPIHG